MVEAWGLFECTEGCFPTLQGERWVLMVGVGASSHPNHLRSLQPLRGAAHGSSERNRVPGTLFGGPFLSDTGTAFNYINSLHGGSAERRSDSPIYTQCGRTPTPATFAEKRGEWRRQLRRAGQA